MQDTTFPLTLRLRIDWSELDSFGHVNNVSYFKYIQAARVHYWEHTGLMEMYRETRTGPVLVSCNCDFKFPLHYPGHVEIHSGVERIGKTSFSICHRLLDNTGRLVAEARDVIVMFDFERNEKQPIPGELKDEIEILEGRKL